MLRRRNRRGAISLAAASVVAGFSLLVWAFGTFTGRTIGEFFEFSDRQVLQRGLIQSQAEGHSVAESLLSDQLTAQALNLPSFCEVLPPVASSQQPACPTPSTAQRGDRVGEWSEWVTTTDEQHTPCDFSRTRICWQARFQNRFTSVLNQSAPTTTTPGSPPPPPTPPETAVASFRDGLVERDLLRVSVRAIADCSPRVSTDGKVRPNLDFAELLSSCEKFSETSIDFVKRSFLSYGLHFHRQLKPPSQSFDSLQVSIQTDLSSDIVSAFTPTPIQGSQPTPDEEAAEQVRLDRIVSLLSFFNVSDAAINIHTNQPVFVVCAASPEEAPQLGGNAATSFGATQLEARGLPAWDTARSGVIHLPNLDCDPDHPSDDGSDDNPATRATVRAPIGDIYSHLELEILSPDGSGNDFQQADRRCIQADEQEGTPAEDIVPSWMLAARDIAEGQQKMLPGNPPRLIEPDGVLNVSDLDAGGVYYSGGNIRLRREPDHSAVPGSVSVVSAKNIIVETSPASVRFPAQAPSAGTPAQPPTITGGWGAPEDEVLALIAGCDVVVETLPSMPSGSTDDDSLSWEDDTIHLSRVAVLAPYGGFYPSEWSQFARQISGDVGGSVAPTNYKYWLAQDIADSDTHEFNNLVTQLKASKHGNTDCYLIPFLFSGSITTGYLGAFSTVGNETASTILDDDGNNLICGGTDEGVPTGFNLIQSFPDDWTEARPPFWPKPLGGEWQRIS